LIVVKQRRGATLILIATLRAYALSVSPRFPSSS